MSDTPKSSQTHYENAAAKLAVPDGRVMQVLSAALRGPLTLAEVAVVITHEITTALDAGIGILCRLSEDGSRYQIIRTVGVDEELQDAWAEFPIVAPVPIADAVRARSPLYLQSWEELVARYPDIALPKSNAQGGALAAIPLLSGEVVVGGLGLILPRGRTFGEAEQAFLLAVSRLCADALERARHFDASRAHHAEDDLRAATRSLIHGLMAEVRRATEDFETLLSILPASVFIAEDPQCLRVRGNPNAERILGAMPLANISRRAPAEERLTSYQIFQNGRELPDSELPVRLAVEGRATVMGTELEIVREDGRRFHMKGGAAPLYDEKGNVRGGIGASVDITEHIETQRALAESEERYRLWLELTPDALWVYQDDRIVYANPALVAQFGVKDVSEIIGHSPLEFIHPDFHEAMRGHRQQITLSAGDVVRFQENIVRPDSTVLDVEVVATKINYGGAPAVLVISRDISERRQNEEKAIALLARERQIAATLQRSLLQMQPPDAFPGLDLGFVYAGGTDGLDVGGDFLDAFALDGGRVALVVGDVSGKGLAAAAKTSETKFALRAFLREYPYPALALTRLNGYLAEAQRLEGGADGFTCLSLAVLDPQSCEATFSVAGAEPPLIVRKGGECVPVALQGMPLAAYDKAQYTQLTLRLRPGDLLLMTTDGITEARQGGMLLGYEGLMRLAAAASLLTSAERIAQDILDGATAFAGGFLSDDACVLAARCLSEEA